MRSNRFSTPCSGGPSRRNPSRRNPARRSPCRRSRARLHPFGGPLFLLLGLAACDESLDPLFDSGPIAVAASVSQTGRFAQLGGEVGRGYQLGIEMLNEKGGIAGREVELILNDDGSDVLQSENIYGSFAGTRSDAFLGPYSSPLTEIAVAIAEASGKPMVAPMAAAPGIWERQHRQWSVQMLNPGPTYLQGSVELAAQHGAASAALVYENSQFPASVAEGIREAARTHGVEIVLDRSYPVGEADHEGLVSAAMEAGADLFIGGGYYDDAVDFTRAVHAVGYKPLMVSLNLGAAETTFAEQLGDLARCVAGNAPWLPTIRTSGFLATSEEFVQRYQAVHGSAPSYYAAGACGAVELLAEAMTAAGGVEVLDRHAIRDRLFSLTTETVLGPFGVHPMGDPSAGAQRALKGLQVQWQDDGAGGLTRRIVHPPSAANADPCFLR